MKQNFSKLLVLLGLSAISTLAAYAASNKPAYAESASDKSVPPIVMIIYDTSGSMDTVIERGDGEALKSGEKGPSSYGSYDSNSHIHPVAVHTRHTRAVAELAGTPKRPPGVSNNRLIQDKYIIFPRSKRICTDTECHYELIDYYPLSTNYAVSALYPNETCDNNRRYWTGKKFLNQLRPNCTLEDFENAYLDDGILQAYKYTVKFGLTGFGRAIKCDTDEYKNQLYGYKKIEDNGIFYGRDDIASLTYKKCDDYDKNYIGQNRSSMYTNALTNPFPLTYPTVSDEQTDIANSNRAIINAARSYYLSGWTQIGPVLADTYFMFGGDSPDFHTADEGMYKQHLYNKSEITEDPYYACRPKAVLLITDGEPSGYGYRGLDTSEHGHRAFVWNDAAHLYKAGIKVYAIGYAFSNEEVNVLPGKNNKGTSNINKASTLNHVAWKGGTCRDPVTGLIINPDSIDQYKAMINRKAADGKTLLPKEKRTCFYNATDNTALRNAMVTALSDMLQSTVSKTRIATTHAISMKNNIVNGKYNNGYYSIYSGYEITLGQVRNSKLQRETTACNHNTGDFETDKNQFMDLAQRLACRITDCKTWKTDETTGEQVEVNDSTLLTKAGYDSAPTTCAPHGAQTAHPVSGNTNSCLNERYIFTGNYKSNRYAINPTNTTLVKKDGQNYIAGYIKNALGKGEDASFLTQNAGKSGKCEQEKDKYIFENFTINTNYMLSPYECVNNLDCGLYNNIPRQCDVGRCVNPGEYATMDQSCHDNTASTYDGTTSVSEACIAGRMRSIGTECDQHSDCEEGSVCHAGYCLPGTVFNCDIRQFMATQRLGTIEYATPAPVNPPSKAYPSSTYKEFSKKYWQRDTMLLVGANDGMLHAFILGDNSTSEGSAGSQGYTSGLYEASESIVPTSSKRDFSEGDELWAFIPKTIMPKLQNLTNYGPQSLVNATPVVADVATPEPYTFSDGTTADTLWRTVAVGGFREGGRGYYALDITNPGQPKILWEIDHQWQKNDDSATYPNMLNSSDLPVSLEDDVKNRTSKKLPFQLMGYSFPEPVITNVLIRKTVGSHTVDVVEPVAILSGGYNLTDNPDNRVGKALYIVRLFPKSQDDLLVKAFYFENEVTGTPSVYPSNFNAIAQHIYVGDANSALYRLDVNTYINPDGSTHSVEQWGSLEKREIDGVQYEKPIFEPVRLSAMGGHPSSTETQIASPYGKITYKPAVSLYAQNSASASVKPMIQITYATGSNDNFNVTSADHNYAAYFYDVYTNGHYQLNPAGFSEKPMVVVFNAPDGVTENPASNMAKENNMEFAIYKTDPLNGHDIEDRQKITGAPITYNFVSYFPTFIASNAENKAQCVTGSAAIWKIGDIKDVARSNKTYSRATNVQNTTNDQSFDGSVYTLSTGTKIYGLEITNQMFCKNEGDSNKSKVSAPQLVAQTGGEATAITNDQGSAKLKPKGTELNNFAINLDALNPNTVPISWASVYE